jgi:hypothetical protein
MLITCWRVNAFRILREALCLSNSFLQYWEHMCLNTEDEGNSRISVSGKQMPSFDVMIQICARRNDRP